MTTDQLRGTCLFLLCVFAGLYFYTDRQQALYEQTARPEAEQILSDISNWEQHTLLENLSEEAKQTINDQQLEKLLQHYRGFGELKSVGELSFSKLVSALSLFGSKRINYQGSATYASGPANINITLVPYGQGYRIYNFTITAGN